MPSNGQPLNWEPASVPGRRVDQPSCGHVGLIEGAVMIEPNQMVNVPTWSTTSMIRPLGRPTRRLVGTPARVAAAVVALLAPLAHPAVVTLGVLDASRSSSQVEHQVGQAGLEVGCRQAPPTGNDVDAVPPLADLASVGLLMLRTRAS